MIIAHQAAIDDAARVAADRAKVTTHQAIEAANRSYLDGWAQHYRLMQAWAAAAGVHRDIALLLDQEIERNIARNERGLQRMRAAGRIAADIDPAYTARALSSMVMQFCIRTFRHGPDGVDIDRAVRTLTAIWTRGIGLDSAPTYRH